MPNSKPAAKTAAHKAADAPARTTRSAGSRKGPDGLTDQQRAFVAEYLIDRNGTQAAIRAGYSPAAATPVASRLLTHANVRAAIDQHQAAVIAKVQHDTGVTLERTVREIARIGFFDPRKLFDARGNPLAITDLDDDTAAAIAGLDVLEEWEGSGENRVLRGYVKKWKLGDKGAALEKLMKHLGGYGEDHRQKTDPLLALITEMGSRRSSFEPVRQAPDETE